MTPGRSMISWGNSLLTFALLLDLALLKVFSLHVEHILNRVGAAHEIRMVGIDIGVLNLNHIAHHFPRWLKFLRQERVHDFDNLATEVLETRKLVHLDLRDHAAQLLVDEVHTLQ